MTKEHKGQAELHVVSTVSKVAVSSSATTMSACTRIARDGTSLRVFPGEQTQRRQILAHASCATRGPIQVIALIDEIEAEADEPGHDPSAASPKM